jgi:hypothetical protein
MNEIKVLCKDCKYFKPKKSAGSDLCVHPSSELETCPVYGTVSFHTAIAMRTAPSKCRSTGKYFEPKTSWFNKLFRGTLCKIRKLLN